MVLKLNCIVLTPDRQLYEGQIHFAVVQAYDGEIGFLFNHAPFVSELGIGEMRLRTGDVTEYLTVQGGFVEIKNNELIILAENAYKKEELVKDTLEKQLNDLQARMQAKEKKTLDERMVFDVELRQLKARLRVASR